MNKSLKVAELFAGVGGFRVGLEKANKKLNGPQYRVVWSNQWEPMTKVQHASDVYVSKWGRVGHSNENIEKVCVDDIPDHDLLVGGFPCQDYSVARTLHEATGLVGQKGILWWQIHRILLQKRKKPKYLLFENVDRLLRSPANQRGRDFAIMLASLAKLDYIVEWRVINAADYGFPQRRRRIFFIGYHSTSKTYKAIRRLRFPMDWTLKKGVLASAFPCSINQNQKKYPLSNYKLSSSLVEVTKSFDKDNQEKNRFFNSGIMVGGEYWSVRVEPEYSGPRMCLKSILIKEKEVTDEYYIDGKDISKWRYLKKAKSVSRKSRKTGHKYKYTEGSMAFPDPLDTSSRTIVTGEGGRSPSRFKHVVKQNGRLRRLTPVELERLNMFPDKHTEGLATTKRAFLMGNALVVGVVERIGISLLKIISKA